MPDAFHSGSRLDEVSKVTGTSESPGEVLTLGQVVCHAPCDINGEGDCLINLSGGHLLNQLNDVRNGSRNLMDTWAFITAWSATGFLETEETRPTWVRIAQRRVEIEKGAFYEQAPNPTSVVVVKERRFRIGVSVHQRRELSNQAQIQWKATARCRGFLNPPDALLNCISSSD